MGQGRGFFSCLDNKAVESIKEEKGAAWEPLRSNPFHSDYFVPVSYGCDSSISIEHEE
jgi:hypothetical protein